MIYMISKTKREKMEKLIYDVFDILDPSGTNTNKYKKLFSSLNNNEFDDFFVKVFNNNKEYFTLDIVEYERGLSIERASKAIKLLGYELFENVCMPHITMDSNNIVVTKEPVLTGYLIIKRPQQMLHHKNGLSTNIDKRSQLTGQVSGDDKNGRESDVETSALMALGADPVIRELHGARSDDMTAKNEMYSAISNKGYVSLDELTNDTKNKTTLNTVDTYFIGMGLKTDLITKGLILNKTIDDNA